MLVSLISQAFALTNQKEFKMTYFNRELRHQDVNKIHNQTTESSNSSSLIETNNKTEYFTLSNDWDLDAAFHTSANPYLLINIEIIECETDKKQTEHRDHAHEEQKDEPEEEYGTEENSEQMPLIRMNSVDKSTNMQQVILNEWQVINSNELVLHKRDASFQKQLSLNSEKNLNKSKISKEKNGFHKSTSSSSLSKSNVQMNLSEQEAKSSTTSLNRSSLADKAVSVIHRMFSSFSLSQSNSKKSQLSSSIELNSSAISNVANETSKVALSPNLPSGSHSVINLTNTSTSAAQPIYTLNNSSLNQNTSIQIVNIFDLSQIEHELVIKQPLNEYELRNFLDSDGRIVQMSELRQRIFDGGCDPTKRKDLWPLLLNVYPHEHMTQTERTEFIRVKSKEYENMKQTLWQNDNKTLLQIADNSCGDSADDSLQSLAHKIYKDVQRTDRNQRFFAGDSNKNIEYLFNILVTYSLAHSNTNPPDLEMTTSKPNVTPSNWCYAQGMSDLLSPLLYVLKDEALTYLCFCSLIERCMNNFDVFSDNITLKINILRLLLEKHDPKLWSYLCSIGADHLLYVYRWLLLECKREFPFTDSLRVFEVMWSTISNTNGLSSTIDQSNRFERRSNSNASSSISLRVLGQQEHYNSDDEDDDNAEDENVQKAQERNKTQINEAEFENEGNRNEYFSSSESGSSACEPNRTKPLNSQNKTHQISTTHQPTIIAQDLNENQEQTPNEKRQMRKHQKNCHLMHHLHHKTNCSHRGHIDARRLNRSLSLSCLHCLVSDQESPGYFKPNSEPIEQIKLANMNNRDQMDIFSLLNKEPISCTHSNQNNNNKSKPIEIVSHPTSNHLLSVPQQLISTSETETITNQYSSFIQSPSNSSMSNNRLSQQISSPHSYPIDMHLFNYSNCNSFCSLVCSCHTEYEHDPSITSIQHQTPTSILSMKTSRPIDKCSSPKMNPDSSLDWRTVDVSQERNCSSSSSSHFKVFRNYLKTLTAETSNANQEEPIDQKKSEDLELKVFCSFETPSSSKNETSKSHCSSKSSSISYCTSSGSSSSSSAVMSATSNNLSSRDSVVSSSDQNTNESAIDNRNENNCVADNSQVDACFGRSSSISLTSNCSTPFHLNSSSKMMNTNCSSASQPIKILNFNRKSSGTSRRTGRDCIGKATNIFDNSLCYDDSSLLVQVAAANLIPDDEELVYLIGKLDNPFLLFLCMAIFMENREQLLKSHMDANDIACYFDKMARKQNVRNVLNRARYLYTKLYLSKANVYNYVQQVMEIQNSP
jgi:hypothetical protein